MKVVKTLSFNPETAQLLERLAEKLEKTQSEIVRELIIEKADKMGIKTKNQNLS